MHDANAVSTPMAVHSTSFDDTAYHDPYLYKSPVGALQYLTFIRPDLTFMSTIYANICMCPPMQIFS